MSIFQKHSFQKSIAAVVLTATLSILPISAGALPAETPVEPVTAGAKRHINGCGVSQSAL